MTKTINNLIFVICYLLFIICSCDLFSGSRVDLLQTISDEVDWANAPKLSVRIEYPSDWGRSNPQQGSITPAMDIRKGYEFSLEFTPNTVYTLKSWQVYRTADLTPISGDWQIYPALIAEERIAPLVFPDVELTGITKINAQGGTYTFTIHTTDPVTLIPWCEIEPRITLTDPRNRPTGDPVSRASPIVIYFNSALNEDTVKFADAEGADGIWITAVSEDGTETNQDKGWYSGPKYVAANGFFMVTINPALNLPPGDSLITVYVKGIKDIDNVAMDGVYSFSWKTKNAPDILLNSWSAEYFHNAGTNSGHIEIVFDQKGDNEVKTYYRLNSGSNIPFTVTINNESGKFTGRIDNVPGPDASGVREGRQVSGIREYEIFIDLYEGDLMIERASFKIWNFPGISASYDYTTETDQRIIPISTAADFADLQNGLGLDRQYVLVDDITVTGTWTPIGAAAVTPTPLETVTVDVIDDDSPAFTGKFYGAGHTVTLNGGIGGERCMGLFGYAKGALIRDFTLEYRSANAISSNKGVAYKYEIMTYNDETGEPEMSDVHFNAVMIGGVAGYLKDATACNIITSGGPLNTTCQGFGNIYIPTGESVPDGAVFAGGIAGCVEGSGKIENCRAALSVGYSSNMDAFGVMMGAVAGVAGAGDPNNAIPFNNGLSGCPASLPGLLINKATVAANLSLDNFSYPFALIVGGAVGMSTQNTLNDITFTNGTISFSGNARTVSSCAGLVGMSLRANVAECLFLGNVNASSGAAGELTVSGLVGQNDTGVDSGGNYYIHNCRVRGDITFTGGGDMSIAVTAVGVLGSSRNYSQGMYITNSFFEGGNITATVSGGYDSRVNAGGFCGQLEGSQTINNCGALNGTVSVDADDVSNMEINVGGFSPSVAGSVSNSFSRIDITVSSSTTAMCNVGGFTGQVGWIDQYDISSQSGFISNCYAAGTVNVTNTGVVRTSGYYGRTNVGGLAGSLCGTILNSYALGNVRAFEDGGPSVILNVGGLVGYSGNTQNVIGGCFSAGRVSAQVVYNNGGYPAANLGGIVGYTRGYRVWYNVALGASVTLIGSSSINIGRICGVNGYGGSSALSVNYVSETMKSGYATSVTSAITEATGNAADNTTYGKNGGSVSSASFFISNFWYESIAGYSASYAVDGFYLDSGWDYSRVARDGYPRLWWEQ